VRKEHIAEEGEKRNGGVPILNPEKGWPSKKVYRKELQETQVGRPGF